ncbi:MAG: hypothetical protein LBU69_06500, partial [Deltaproteobacteria bacterium]|nr:hypothetical protein [Deltaproteobacteria bacterium]
MTRLIPSDISALALNWAELERRLIDLAGLGFLGLAGETLGLSLPEAQRLLGGKKVAVIPNTSGEGLIEGFSQGLQRIANGLGCEAIVTSPDLQGHLEAREFQSELILTSDDINYYCQNTKTGTIAQNGHATGLGFAHALYLMAKRQVSDEIVLVIGAGPVGAAAASHLSGLGARVILFDLDRQKALNVASTLAKASAWSIGHGLIPGDFKLILEASTSPLVWPQESVQAEATIS